MYFCIIIYYPLDYFVVLFPGLKSFPNVSLTPFVAFCKTPPIGLFLLILLFPASEAFPG